MADQSIDESDQARVEALTEALLREVPPDTVDRETFLGAQFDRGLAWVHFDAGDGGIGVRPGLQRVVQERIVQAGGPHPGLYNPIGYGMGAPTIFTHGSPQQRSRYLRPLFTGEEVWCQMFSEPGAGSDVAGLATMAVRDGDEWVINGQKVWTTLGHKARFGMLLARTDPSVPKHAGMTYFVIDMAQPGVEVRPIRQITGEAEFNEIFFSDARVPDSERLSDVGDGWRVAITTLMNERVSIGGAVPPRGSGLIARAVDAYRSAAMPGPVMRDRLMRLWSEAEVLRLTNMRAAQLRKAGTPGPEGSVGKLTVAELNKKIAAYLVDAAGPAGMEYADYTFRQPDRALGFEGDDPRAFLRIQANSIEGGTTEVMRNIIGERVLGLQGEPRSDRDIPWNQVPRN